MEKPIVFFVPFRRGSKGLKNKNIKKLLGVPLFAHTIAQANRFSYPCYVSTDYDQSELLVDNSCNLDFIYIKRREELCGDNAPIVDVVSDYIRTSNLKDTIIVLLQVTSPLRDDIDIKLAIDKYKEGEYDLVMSVTLTDGTPLKYGFVNSGRFSSVNKPEFCFTNRQDLPLLYRPNGMVYVFNSNWFIQSGGFSHCKSIGAVEVDITRSIDIDSEAEFKIIEDILLCQKSD